MIATGASLDDILGPKRQRDIAYIRFGVVFTARCRGRSLSAIARALGRDHTTIIHAQRRAIRLLVESPEFGRFCHELDARS